MPLGARRASVTHRCPNARSRTRRDTRLPPLRVPPVLPVGDLGQMGCSPAAFGTAPSRKPRSFASGSSTCQNAEQFSVGGAAATGPRWQCVHRAGDRKLDWTKLPSAVGLYGCCIAGRRHWRGLAGRCRQVAGPPAVGGDGREGGRAARGEGRRRRSTVPETPGGAEARLADVDAPVTTNPEWAEHRVPFRRAGRRLGRRCRAADRFRGASVSKRQYALCAGVCKECESSASAYATEAAPI